MNQMVHRFKAEFFKALAHPARLVILEQLQVRADLTRQLPFGTARSKRRQQAEDDVAHELSSRAAFAATARPSCLHWTYQWRMSAAH